MPSFVSTKAEMICSGILPIDQMRDHVPAASLISFTKNCIRFYSESAVMIITLVLDTSQADCNISKGCGYR